MPSFVRALFVERDGILVKVAGWRQGARMWQEGEYVLGEGCSVEELRYWTGLWLSRESLEHRVPHLASAYRSVGLSVSPYDRDLLFVPIFLSRATSWEINVIKWCRAIFSRASTFDELLELDFEAFGGSFQLRQLKLALEEFKCLLHTLNGDPWVVRQRLLSIRHVGPKLADAYLLFTGLDASAIPIDRHAIRMSRRLGIAERFRIPVKALCMRFRCDECPASRSCLRALLSARFGDAGGWVQTVFYLQDIMYCSRSACSECPLKSLCLEVRKA